MAGESGLLPVPVHRLTSLYGAQRAVAADLDGDGDLDIVAVCFLPGSYYQSLCREMDLDAAILLEQVAPGRFVRHSLETMTATTPPAIWVTTMPTASQIW